MKKEEKAYDALLAVILFIPSVLFSAYTTMTLWNWFISDTFNIIKLGMWQAYGIDLVVTYITYKKTNEESDKKSFAASRGMFEAILITGLFLLTGLVVKQFI